MVSGAAQQGKASSLFFYAGRVVTQKTLIGTLPLEPDAYIQEQKEGSWPQDVRPMRSLIIGGFCSDMPIESSHDN